MSREKGVYQSTLISHGYKQSAFTLIEVLVGVVILSIGILGLISLESVSLKSNQDAYYRSQATVLIYDLADKMRSNAGIDYTTITASSAVGCISYTTTIPAGCSQNQIAENDLSQWTDAVKSHLPSGTPSLSKVGEITRVTVSWDSNRDGEVKTDNSESFSVDFDL